MTQVLITTDDLRSQAESFVAGWEHADPDFDSDECEILGVSPTYNCELCAEKAEGYGYEDQIGWFDEYILEVKFSASLVGQISSFTVVVGTGGPHVEFTVDGQSSAMWEGYWGSDSPKFHHGSYENVYTAIADYLGEMVSEIKLEW